MEQSQTLPTFDAPVEHPAKYSPDLLRVMQKYLRAGWLVYDPFGGTGGLHRIASQTGAVTVCGEIEPRVIANARGTRSIAANALSLPFANETFDAIATSPTYGNRLADKRRPNYKGITFSYAHTFGFDLHPENTGAYQFNEKYRALHWSAYIECLRVLKRGGLFILNMSDHIRAGQRVAVSQWHVSALESMGLDLLTTETVKTQRLTRGENSKARTGHEYIFVLRKGIR